MKFKTLILTVLTSLILMTNTQANDINSSWNSAYLYHYAQSEKHNNMQAKLDQFIKTNSKDLGQQMLAEENKASNRCLNFLKNLFGT